LSLNWVQASDDLKIRLMPNPASQVVQIVPENHFGEIKVEIFSVIGNKILEQHFGNAEQNNLTVNIAAIPDGIYLVRVTSGAHATVKRLKIQHG
jgi:Secretion system C-terminal sorting domain